jgi:hypothetical protein
MPRQETIAPFADRAWTGAYPVLALAGPTGLFRKVTTPAKAQTDLLAELSIPAPKQVIDLTPAAH